MRLFNFLEGNWGVTGTLVVDGADSTQGDGDRDDCKSDQGTEKTLQADVFAFGSDVVDVTTGPTYIRSNTDTRGA